MYACMHVCMCIYMDAWMHISIEVGMVSLVGVDLNKKPKKE